MNNSVFDKTMANVPKHREIKLVTNDERMHYSMSKPNNHSIKLFFSNRDEKNKSDNENSSLILICNS